jgi:hypothetical protein
LVQIGLGIRKLCHLCVFYTFGLEFPIKIFWFRGQMTPKMK